MCSLSAFQTLLDSARLLVCSPFSILLCVFFVYSYVFRVYISDTAGLCTFAVCSPFSITCVYFYLFLRVPCLHFRHCWTLHGCLCALLKYTVSPSRVYFYVFPVCISDTAGLCAFACVLSFFYAVCIFLSFPTCPVSALRYCWALRVCLCVFCSDTAGLQCLHFRHCWALHVCLCDFTSDTAGLCTFACVSSLQTLLNSNIFTSYTAGLCMFACVSSFQTLLDFNVFTSDTAGLQCLHFRHCWTPMSSLQTLLGFARLLV